MFKYSGLFNEAFKSSKLKLRSFISPFSVIIARTCVLSTPILSPELVIPLSSNSNELLPNLLTNSVSSVVFLSLTAVDKSPKLLK